MTTMTGVTFAEAAATGAEAVKAAQGILGRAKDCQWPDDPEAREARDNAVWKVADALAMYERLRTGIIRPGDEIPGLGAGPGGLAEALGAIADDASRDAAVLADVIAKVGGGEVTCKAHPDDCPNGPGPHLYVPPDSDRLVLCCRQPGEGEQ